MALTQLEIAQATQKVISGEWSMDRARASLGLPAAPNAGAVANDAAIAAQGGTAVADRLRLAASNAGITVAGARVPGSGAPSLGGPVSGSGGGAAEKPVDLSARAIIRATLSEYGLEDLADWAWEQFLQGAPVEQIMLDIRQRPEYQRRFPGMAALRKRGRAISEREYIGLERQYAEVFSRAGVPKNFYDTPDDFQKFIEEDKSPAEVQARVFEGFVRVARAAPEVRDWFRRQFGAEGDPALLAVYLDTQRALPVLERMTAQAEIGGAGLRFGFDLSSERAGRIADVAGSDAGQQGIARLDDVRALFTESVSEQADFTAEREGVDAVFGLGEGGGRKVERRRRERAAAFAGGGGAEVTGRGVIGLGAAQ